MKFLHTASCIVAIALSMPAKEPSFVPNPSGRGTLDLLWECLFTIFLCVWTAVHPDTPPRNLSQRNYMSKIAWCLIIFLFPELAFQYILTEFASAKLFRDRRNALIKGDNEATEELSIHPEPGCLRKNILSGGFNSTKWSLKHGYLVTMGALQFRLGEQSAKFPTELGFEKFAECNILPSAAFLNERIKRRQKSDYLSKAIVCIQVSWMVIQTISRRISGLPITLLELTTLAQVWFALSVYAVWWHKPQGFDEPIEVDFNSCPSCLQYLELTGLSKPEVLADELPQNNFVRKFKHFILFLSIDAFVSLIYFGIHTIGWRMTFPTQAERMLWQIAACVYGGSLVMYDYY